MPIPEHLPQSAEALRQHLASLTPAERSAWVKGNEAHYRRGGAAAVRPPEPLPGATPGAVLAYMQSLPPAEAKAWRAANEAAFVNHNKAIPGR